MEKYFSEPYPARAAVGVASLTKRGSLVEADGFLGVRLTLNFAHKKIY